VWRAIVVVLLIAAAETSRAQSATGSIEGHVVDPSGAAVPGVLITLHQPASGVTRTLTTDQRGLFRAPLLPVGTYALTAAHDGFDTWHDERLRLGVGQTLTLQLELSISGVAKAVVVPGAALLERSRAHAATTIGETAIRNLPVNGRNFLDFVLLSSGVTRDVRSGDLSFSGQRGTLNSLVVDGADNNNTFAGQTLGRAGSGSQDAVQEFQVNTSAYSAEYGRAAGGVVNVVTKSGTNTWHGSLFEFYRDKALNATNAIDRANHRPKAPYHYHQFGGTLGGPLRPSRDFFFVNYDGQRHTQPNAVLMTPPASTPDDELTRAALERLRPLAASWSRRLDQDVFFARTDHQLGTADRVTVRYNHQDFTGRGFESGGPLSSFEHTGDSIVNTRTLHVNWLRQFRGMFSELRAQYAHDAMIGTANSDAPEALIRHGGVPLLLIGRNFFSPRSNTLDRVQIAHTTVVTRGAHTIKAGVDVQLDRLENFFPGYFSGSYVFQSLASFARGRPDGPGELYQQNFAGEGTHGPYSRPDVSEYSGFVQDQWMAAPDLTLSLGLRYDLMTVAASPVRNPDSALAAAGIDTSRLDADTDNWGPRLGVAWSPRARRYIVRGGWGFFYGRNPAIMTTTTHGNNGVSVISLTFRGSDVPTYPERFTAIPIGTAAAPNIYYVDADFASPRVTQGHAALEWLAFSETRVTAGYLFADGRQLPRSVDRNIGSPGSRTFTVTSTGQPVTYHVFGADRPFTNFGRVIALESTAESRYHGLTLDVRRRLRGEAELTAAYTLGRVIDTAPDATAVAVGSDDGKFASNPADPAADRALGQNDQRHRFVASGVYSTEALASGSSRFSAALVRGWIVGAIITAQSGVPYSARVGLDINGDGNAANDLAPGTRRNQFRLPAIVTVDARVAREIPLARRVRAQIIWEAFNLLNRANINGVAPSYYTVSLPALTLTPNAEFGQPRSSAGERIMQLAARIVF
jgi:outer membrane receptor protein involved in Fe transport